jgi:predicted membrane protein
MVRLEAKMDKKRRYLLGLEPIFEGGWLHKGKRAHDWNVEKELVAVSILGDVTIDLTKVKSLPSEVQIDAYAIGRDVDIIVPARTHVQMNGRANNGHLNNGAPSVPSTTNMHTIRVTGHTFLGDVTTRDSVDWA